eukprot:TRINITY_DN16138_c0_g1_i5.p1 TRINITY_DN16138_c0_g1~~TRINITY_DN16138_c0_g1_i5.p1  ORF type:complete len:334 (+),score=69.35 TRINITY_DN16138_c0_g1_i5:271-1272(+)
MVAHCSHGVQTLALLIDSTSPHIFRRSISLISQVMSQAQSNLASGSATRLQRRSAQYRDLVATVPGLEEILISAGFDITHDGGLCSLEADSSMRRLHNVMAEVRNAGDIRDHRMRSKQMDEMIDGCRRRSEKSEGWKEFYIKKGTAMCLECEDSAALFKCIATLEAILQNILKSPDKSRYRQIALDNPRFESEVLSVKGGLEYLTSAGFVTSIQSSHLVLPKSACLWKLRAALNGLECRAVNTVYHELARTAELQGLIAHQTSEALYYEMNDQDVPAALGLESSRNYLMWHRLEAPVPAHTGCLLYTSDAADEEDSVDLGGRRIIKKKKKKEK